MTPLTMAYGTVLGILLVTAAHFLEGALRKLGRPARWARKHTGGMEVLVSEQTGPAAMGLLRPRVVVPSWAFSLEPEELEMVLLHEQEHLRARDPGPRPKPADPPEKPPWSSLTGFCRKGAWPP